MTLSSIDPRRLAAVTDGARALALHEIRAMGGHLASLQARLAVARRAGSLSELVRDQLDLVPETRLRMQADSRLRKLLLRRLGRDLRRLSGR